MISNSSSTKIHSFWFCLLPGCSPSLSRGSPGEQYSAQPCFEEEFGLVDLQGLELFSDFSQPQCLWITRLVALLAWKSQKFCLSPVGKWSSCLTGAGHSVKTWLWRWRKSEMTRVITRLLGGIAWQCSWKWERLFSADGILLTVSAFSIFKWILVLLQLVWQLLLLFWQAALVCHLSTSAASV